MSTLYRAGLNQKVGFEYGLEGGKGVIQVDSGGRPLQAEETARTEALGWDEPNPFRERAGAEKFGEIRGWEDQAGPRELLQDLRCLLSVKLGAPCKVLNRDVI